MASLLPGRSMLMHATVRAPLHRVAALTPCLSSQRAFSARNTAPVRDKKRRAEEARQAKIAEAELQSAEADALKLLKKAKRRAQREAAESENERTSLWAPVHSDPGASAADKGSRDGLFVSFADRMEDGSGQRLFERRDERRETFGHIIGSERPPFEWDMAEPNYGGTRQPFDMTQPGPSERRAYDHFEGERRLSVWKGSESHGRRARQSFDTRSSGHFEPRGNDEFGGQQRHSEWRRSAAYERPQQQSFDRRSSGHSERRGNAGLENDRRSSEWENRDAHDRGNRQPLETRSSGHFEQRESDAFQKVDRGHPSEHARTDTFDSGRRGTFQADRRESFAPRRAESPRQIRNEYWAALFGPDEKDSVAEDVASSERKQDTSGSMSGQSFRESRITLYRKARRTAGKWEERGARRNEGPVQSDSDDPWDMVAKQAVADGPKRGSRNINF